MRMPTLCALNGGVYGGATDMALACDFRLGVKGMRFFMPAARFGLHYYPGGLRRYTQKVSPSFAKRAFLLSEDFTDEALLRVGYLDWLVDRSEFAAKVDETAAKLAGLAPLSMANMKRAIEQFAQAEPDIPAHSRRHPRMPDVRGPARRPGRPAREARAGLQGPLTPASIGRARHARPWNSPCSVASPPSSTPISRASPG